MIRITLFLYLVLNSVNINGQMVELSDTITGNKTQYTHLHDSIYRFVSTFNGKIITNGKIINPDFNQHVKRIIKNSDQNYLSFNSRSLINVDRLSDYRIVDTCKEFDLRGKITNEIIVVPGSYNIVRTFNNGILTTETVYSQSYGITRLYDANGKIYYERKTTYEISRVVKEFTSGKTRTVKYVYDTLRNDYLPTENYHKTYYDGSGTYDYVRNDPKTHLTIEKGGYNHENGIKWEQTFKYDRKKRCVKTSSTIYNEKTKSNQKYIVKKTYDKQGHLVHSSEKCNHVGLDYLDCRNGEFKYNVSSGVISYNETTIKQRFKLLSNGILINNKPSEFDSFVIIATDKEIHCTKFGNGKKIQSRHRQNVNLKFPDRYDDSTDASNFIYSLLFGSGLTYNDLYLYNQEYWTEGSDAPSTIPGLVFTDTFFDRSGKDSFIAIHKGDTVTKYEKINGIYKLDYFSHFIRIAKDFHQCAMGLKTNIEEWIVAAKYNDISMSDDEKKRLYFCTRGSYTDIYDWQGNLIGKDLEHLIYKYHYLNEYSSNNQIPEFVNCYYDEYNESKKLLFVENDSLNIHKLIHINGETALQFPSQFHKVNDYYYVPSKDLFFFCSGENDKIAIFNINGRMTDYKYDWVRYYKPGFYIVSENNENYLIAKDFKTKLSETFNDLININDSIILLKHTDNTVTLFNQNKKENKPVVLNYKNINRPSDRNYFNITDLSGNFHGLANFDLSILIRPEYIFTFEYDSGFICKKAHQYDLYDKTGKLNHSIYVDTIFNLNAIFSEYTSYNKKALSLITKKEDHFGLIDNRFNTIVEPKYIDILNCEGFLMFCDKKDSLCVDFDNRLIEHPFPRNKFINFHSITNEFNDQFNFYNYRDGFETRQYEYGIMNSSGQIIAYPANLIRDAYDRFSLALLYQYGLPMSLIDLEGNVKMNIKGYKNFNEIGDNYFFNLPDEHSGVMGKDCRIKVKPEHQFIAYDEPNELLWFNSLPGQMLLYNSEGNHDIWQLKSLKTGKISKDTFEIPIDFINTTCLLKNNHDFYGVIDTGLNTLIPFEYSELYSLNNYIGFMRSDKVLITDYNFKPMKSIHLQYVGTAENGYWGFYKGKSYLFDSAFNLTDSSYNNFSNSDRRLSIDADLAYWTDMANKQSLELSSSGIETDYDDNAYNEYRDDTYYDQILMTPKNIGNLKINNTLAILFYFTNRTALYNNYAAISYFPYPNYHNFYNNYYDESFEHITTTISLPYTINITSSELTPKAYKPNFAQIDQLTDTRIKVLSYTENFIAYQFQSDAYEESKTFNNLYIDDILGFAHVDLDDLVDPDKKNEFNRILYNRLSKLDDPNIPCYPKTDYLEMFKQAFTITSNGIIFYLNNSTYRFKIDLKELKPCFRDYWRDKF